MNMVTLSSVTKSYEGVEVLRDVSLAIEKGERLVILGPSGCGKTTILRLIAGFIAPDRGEVTIEGEVVSRAARILVPPERRGLGMVFQDLALWPHLTVRGNVAFGLKMKRVPRAERERRVLELLRLFGLEEYTDRKPAELSGGQQQRVALIRALALRPRVLLMDEPLSSLDEELNVKLRREIVGIQEKLGVTLVYVTHDREETREIATRVIRMRKGRIEFSGPPRI